MNRKAIFINPIIWLMAVLVAIIAFVVLTVSPSFQAFIDKFWPLALALIIGAVVGAVTNGFRLLGNTVFNMILLTFYWMFKLLFETWELAENPWIAWLYMPITATFIVGYALGTFFGKLAAG